MLLLTCPHCGPRAEIEFRHGGQAETRRPGPLVGDGPISDEAWAAYLFERANPKGELFEAWCHSGGCGQWFTLRRDTRDNTILSEPGL
ncbi:MAG: sarcosine oxidase subunit delta [Pseudomonadota bacterium]